MVRPRRGGWQQLTLVPIERHGAPRGFAGALPEVAVEVCAATVELYARAGFEEPWVGYLALRDGAVVGACGFKSAPVEGRVEIAYFTFPEFEGCGVATAMATELVAIVGRQRRPLVATAQTLPRPSASTRILEGLGFVRVGTVEDPDEGPVWEWEQRPTDRRP